MAGSREVVSSNGRSRVPKELRQLTDFRSLGVSEAVSSALADRGILTPFQIQALVIPEALRGGDILAKSPTGSGKTLAFAIPIVQNGADGTPFALVLVPTRELCDAKLELVPLVARDEPELARELLQAVPGAFPHAHGVAAPA